MKEDLNTWNDVPCSWTGRLGIVGISVLPKLRYRLNPNLNPRKIVVEIDRFIQKFIWKLERL